MACFFQVEEHLVLDRMDGTAGPEAAKARLGQGTRDWEEDEAVMMQGSNG